MAYTLIVCEKPTAAKAIADALAEGEVKKQGKEGERAVWYEFTNNGAKFVSVPAVGHLFSLKQVDKGWQYPTFNVDWVPSFKANAFAKFSEPYYRNMEELAKGAGDVIIATDYDDEGEVIGYNILRFICGRKDALRLKFSTMTKEELLDSYEHPAKLNKNLIESGLARHYLDWYWGINLSRALTNAIKLAAKRFRVLSTGRVQGPVLHMLAKYEKKIKAFKPEPFWELELQLKGGLKACYYKDKIWDRKEAEKLLQKSKVKEAAVKGIKKKIMSQKPPIPYNTTAFLADVYRFFGYSPQQGLAIAEVLYQTGLISYPRTNSQQLPPDINYKKIITNLAKQNVYEKAASSLLAKELKPTQGKLSSAAHPAIYPTGQAPGKIDSRQKNVYDLVVRRFMACFGDPAKRESQKIELLAGDVLFYLHGTKTIEAGWTALYGKYAAREEVILPAISVGEKMQIKDTTISEKETQPPPRYSQGSVLKEMEASGLGTQATRSQILQILYNRGYLIGKSIEVTELGLQLSDILEKNVPSVISEKLTRHFEEQCDAVEQGKADREEVLKEASENLTKICEEFRKREKKIGEELTKAVIATQDKQSILGTCPKCGGTLRVHKLWRTGKRFVGCSGYKKGCTFSSPLPREGVIMNTEKVCEQCKTSIIQVYYPGRKPFRMCLDIHCPTKKDWFDKEKFKKAQQESIAAKKLAEKLTCECGKSFKTKRALTLHEKTHAKAATVK